MYWYHLGGTYYPRSHQCNSLTEGTVNQEQVEECCILLLDHDEVAVYASHWYTAVE